MLRYLAGITLVGLLLAASAAVAPKLLGGGGPDASAVLTLPVLLVALPVLVSWIVAECLHHLRPRRLFIGARRGSGVLVACGVATALFAFTLAALGLAFLDSMVADGVIICAAFAVATVPALCVLRRHRPGRCVYCGYDLRGTSLRSACTECGAELMPS